MTKKIHFYRESETTEEEQKRLQDAASFKRTKREGETQSEYDQRLDYQRKYDKSRRLRKREYLSEWRKQRFAGETRRERENRISNVMENRDWKANYKR